jgi:hypothetical protein
MERLAKVLGILVFSLLSPVSLGFGQSPTGGVNGTVTDPTGALVPGVRVTLTNQATGIVATGATNDRGIYVFVNVAPGMYILKAEKSGFKTASVAAFEVTVNGTVTLNLALSVGQATQTLEVTGEAPLLQASSSELSTVIEQKTIESLPTNGRNFTELTLLVPGVTPVNTAQEWGSTVALPGSAWIKPTVDGQWSRSNLYLMDGIINTEGETGGYSILPSLDAVQEFSVETHGGKGEYGFILGGDVNLVTKAGSNSFHGSAFEYLRNNAFDARNPFTDITTDSAGNIVAAPPGAFRQNQFGATLGGPVDIPRLYSGKNKMFFFFSYDAWRFSQAASSLYHVPTTAELGGDFSAWPIQIYDPATIRPDPSNPGGYISDPFPGNIIPSDRINSMMVNTMKFLYDTPNIPIESYANGFNNVVNNQPNTNNANAFQVRLDDQLSPKAHLFFRWNHFSQADLAAINLKNGEYDHHTPNQMALVWDQLLTSNIALSSRLSTTGTPWTRSPSHPYSATQWSDLGWSQINQWGGQINVNIAGLGPSGVAGDPNSIASERNWQLSQDLSWVKKNHQLKLGYIFFRQHWWGSDPYAGANFLTSQTANPAGGDAVTGIGLASAILGLPNDTFGSDQYYNQTYNTWGVYGQDQWKLTPKFTFNYSLRWEFVDPPNYKKVTAGDFDYSTGDYWIGGKSLPGPCGTNGVAPCIPGDGNLADLPGGSHIILSPVPNIKSPHRKNFEPRVGVSWEFAHNTLLRAGFGIPYDIFSGVTQENNNMQALWPNNNYGNSSYNQLGQSLQTIDAAEGQALSFAPQETPWLSINYIPLPTKKPPYSLQYNVQLQRQFSENLTVSAAYSGSVTRRLDYGYPVNADPTPGGSSATIDARRPFPYIPTSFGYSFDTGRASYNSLQVEANRRFSKGLSAILAYTWSKSIDNGSSGFFGSENGASGNSAIQNEYDPKSNRSVSGYDVPQNLVVSGSYELPVGKGKPWLSSGPLSWVMGNWRADLIQAVHTSAPWNPYIEGDLANVGRGTASDGGDSYMRPNLIGNPTPSHRTVLQWVNPAAFGIPQGAFGNVSRNSFRSAPTFETDATLAKVIPIYERLNVEFRAEFYNVLNMMNYGTPNPDLSTPNFGQITTLTSTPRQMQFSLRLNF